MNKIITTPAELETKLSEIRTAARKAQAEQTHYYATFYVLASLVPSMPSLIHEKYGYERPDVPHDSPLFKGADTVVVSCIECQADYSPSSLRRNRLTFERRHRDLRCICADGLYLYYPYVYQAKTHSLSSLAYGDLIRKWGGSASHSLSKPNDIGVLTPRKLQAWTDYVKAIVARCEEEQARADAQVAEFRDKLRAICPDKADLNEGSVTIHGLTFLWEIQDKGYIHTECKVHYEYSYGIDSFIKLVKQEV